MVFRRKRITPESAELNYKNVGLLQSFLDASSKILGRKQTGLDAKKQRALQKAVKQARSLGLLPY